MSQNNKKIEQRSTTALPGKSASELLWKTTEPKRPSKPESTTAKPFESGSEAVWKEAAIRPQSKPASSTMIPELTGSESVWKETEPVRNKKTVSQEDAMKTVWEPLEKE